MHRAEREELLEHLAATHWTLVRLHGQAQRGYHRHLLAEADHLVCTVLADLKQQEPRLVAAGRNP